MYVACADRPSVGRAAACLSLYTIATSRLSEIVFNKRCQKIKTNELLKHSRALQQPIHWLANLLAFVGVVYSFFIFCLLIMHETGYSRATAKKLEQQPCIRTSEKEELGIY